MVAENKKRKAEKKNQKKVGDYFKITWRNGRCRDLAGGIWKTLQSPVEQWCKLFLFSHLFPSKSLISEPTFTFMYTFPPLLYQSFSAIFSKYKKRCFLCISYKCCLSLSSFNKPLYNFIFPSDPCWYGVLIGFKLSSMVSSTCKNKFNPEGAFFSRPNLLLASICSPGVYLFLFLECLCWKHK